jgi:AcrR family transcriptional regulator
MNRMTTPAPTRNGSTKRLRTRSLILDAAGALFARQGVAATTVEMILQEARVSRFTFYQNFKDKQQLVGELMAETWRHADELYVSFAALPDASLKSIHGWLTSVQRAWRRHYGETEMLLREVPSALVADSGPHMERFVETMVGDGHLWACPKDEALRRARLLIGQLERGMLDFHRGSWRGVKVGELLDTLARLWFMALNTP